MGTTCCLKVYNSLNFSTKCIENPPCIVFFRSQMTQNMARLPEEITPEQISQISSTRISFICCNTEPNYSRYRFSSCRKKLGTDLLLRLVKMLLNFLTSSKRVINHRGHVFTSSFWQSRELPLTECNFQLTYTCCSMLNYSKWCGMYSEHWVVARQVVAYRGFKKTETY